MKTKIWAALLTLYIVWGSTYLAIRFAVETIPPFFQAGIRFLVSGLVLLVWQWLRGTPMPTRTQWRSLFIIGTLLLLGGTGLIAWAEQFIPSGITALIIGSAPLFMVIAEALRPGGIKPNASTFLGIAMGFAGIFLLVGPVGFGNEDGLDPFGVIAILFSCLLWSLGSVYSKHTDLPKSSLVITGAEMLTGSLSLLAVSLLSGELNHWQVSAVSTRSIWGVVYLIIVGSLIGFVVFGWLLQNAPIALVSTYAYVNPVVAIILGSIFADEVIEPRLCLAAIIIVGSVIFINKTKPVANEAEA